MRIHRLSALLLALHPLCTAAALAAQPLLPAGPEVRLRQDAGMTAAAYAPDGRLLVGFNVRQGAGDALVRFFGRDGAPLGPEVPVHAEQAGFQAISDLAWSADGASFAVVWTQQAAADQPREVVWRRFAADATPLGPEQRVHVPIPGDCSAGRIAAVPGGGWLLAWAAAVERRPAGDGWAAAHVAAKRFRADGAPLGPAFRVTDSPASALGTAGVAVAPDGTGVVAWSHYGGKTTTFDVAVRQVGTAGPLGPVRSLHPSVRGGAPSLVMADDGGFGLVWHNNARQGLVLSRFGPDGTPRGSARMLVQGGILETAAARLPDGRLVVAWTDAKRKKPVGLSGQVFTADGTPDGPRFKISAADPDASYTPRLAVDPDGALAALWYRLTPSCCSGVTPYFRRLETGGTAVAGADTL